MHASAIKLHFPANAHCSELRQSLASVATHMPSFAVQFPLVAHAPLNWHAEQLPKGIRQSASDVAAQALPTRWQAPESPHEI
jgi:hypothetical protein